MEEKTIAMKKKFDVGIKNLSTKPNSRKRYYVHSEELFDLLHTTHLKLGHGGRHQIQEYYCETNHDFSGAVRTLPVEGKRLQDRSCSGTNGF